MISYHPLHPGNDKSKKDCYGWGFKVADTDDIYRDGRRNEVSWLHSDWIVLDFDSGEMTLAQAVNAFCDVRHVISTSMNHQRDKGDGLGSPDRFRISLCIKRIDDLAIYRNNLRQMVDKYPCDTRCKDGARFFFPSREIVSINDEDELWDLDLSPPPAPKFAEIQAARAVILSMPAKTRHLLKHSIWPDNTKNDTCFQLGCQLGPLGYSAKDICHHIYASPTYRDAKITDALAREIYQAVSNGIERAFRDLAAIAAK